VRRLLHVHRYAVSQRAQAVGQAVGLPLAMAAFSFVGLAVTSATTVIFGAAVRDPVQLLSRLQQPAAVCVALLGERRTGVRLSLGNARTPCAPPAPPWRRRAPCHARPHPRAHPHTNAAARRDCAPQA
jgi:hypothetical protein